MPQLLALSLALAAGAWHWLRPGENSTGAALTGLTVLGGFFLGRRIGGAWAGMLMAFVLAAITAMFALNSFPPGAMLLAVMAVWWALRFKDDPALANVLVAVTALAALGWLATRR